MQTKTTLPFLPPIPTMRGRRRRNARFHAPRREGSYRIPLHIGNELESMLRECGNPETSWRVAMLLAMAWTRPKTFGAPFVIDRRALNRLLALRLTENQLRGAIKTLVAIGFLVKVGGGEFDRTRKRNRVVLYQFDPHFAALFRVRIERRRRKICKSPTAGLRPKKERLGRFQKRPSLRRAGQRLCGLLPSAFHPDPHLESALENLRKGVFGEAGALPAPSRGEGGA